MFALASSSASVSARATSPNRASSGARGAAVVAAAGVEPIPASEAMKLAESGKVAKRKVRARASPSPSPSPSSTSPSRASVARLRPSRRPSTKRNRNETLSTRRSSPLPPSAPPLRRAAPQGFVETMGFAGWAPEVINGRVAQIAFVAGAAAEAVTGETLPAQAHDHVFSLAFASSLIALASFMPNVQGEKYTSEPESKGAFGPFSPGKELLHGRLAMVGLAAWIAIESHTGVAFFHR